MPTDRTFLFTDIEGSTRLLRELGDLYADVLERHRTLIESAIATNGGSIVDRSGDELFAAFLDSSGAVAGAVAAQLALAAEPWPEAARVNVRMGLHRGRVHATGGGFVGLAVHQAARVCQTARGGEILISDTVETEAETLDLGEFELRGIPRATRLRRVVAPGLQTQFAPLQGNVPRPAPLRIVLADDSVLLREGIASLLEDAGFEVVGQAGNAEALLELVDETLPELAVVDIRMPPTYNDEGLRAAHEIRRRYPSTGVLVLSSYIDAVSAIDLFGDDPKGVGYLLKERVADVDEFTAAVRRVAEGGTVVDELIVDALPGG